MSEYHFYFINERGHIDSPATVAECAQDDAAIREARKFLDSRDIEIWQGARLVAHLAPGRSGPTIRRKAG
jgi:hypothetical protein